MHQRLCQRLQQGPVSNHTVLLLSGGAEAPVKVKDIGDGVYECEYLPVQTGKYTVNITWGGQLIPRR